jgi:hypothetical protein
LFKLEALVVRDAVLLEGFVTGVAGLARLLVSGFFALKMPAPPPTSAPTSWPNTPDTPDDIPRQTAVDIKTARSIAKAFIARLLKA